MWPSNEGHFFVSSKIEGQQVIAMNVDRFAGENPIMRQFSLAMQQNEALGKARTREAQEINKQLTNQAVKAAYGQI